MNLNWYYLEQFLSENVCLPLSEIRRQIKAGMCRVNGRVVTNPHLGIITGLKVELGQTMEWVA